jgi:hypothetical protein
MWVETGVFGYLTAEGSPAEMFSVRVVIPETDFARLGLGDHERAGALPACFRWLLAAIGPGGQRWSVRLPSDGDAFIYFAEHADACAFFAQWGAAHTEAVPKLRSAA